MTKVRVRGIYSTALTRLFLDAGLGVVQPSRVIAERFGLELAGEEPDVVVADRWDKHGVVAWGREEHVEAVLRVLREELPDAVFRRAPIQLWGIYRARVVDHVRGLVDLGGALAELAEGEELGPDAEEVLVQVVRFDGRKTTVSSFPSIRGRLLVLRPYEPGVEVSKRIADAEARSRLLELGGELAPDGIGLRFRSSSVGASRDDVEAELDELLGAWREVEDAFSSGEGPALLRPGEPVADVEFPSSSKRKLDEVRRSVCPTVEGHHLLKACGGELADAVELAEKLLAQEMEEEQVAKLFGEVLRREMPGEGSRLVMKHVKLDGRVLRVGVAEVLRASEGLTELLLLRLIRGRGFYDGLGARREPGDLALTETGLGSMRLATSYLSPDGSYKGTYVNLNTPVEVCPSYIRYVDLEVDVCVWPDGRSKVLD
ncbi:hypothetical protein DRO32_05195, partial [Candidatus Bathyarchaeota archaeon]